MIFEGKKLANEKEKVLQEQVKRLVGKLGFAPKLVAILVGNNPASQIYLRLKGEAAQRIGIDFEKKEFPEDVDPQEVIAEIKRVNQDDRVWGIMVQLPLPKESGIRNQELGILGTIAPAKDIDCLTPHNLGLLAMGQPKFLPATVRAVLTIIQNSRLAAKQAKFIIQNSNVVVVGRSNIVGKPLALILTNLGATVTVCHSKTKNLSDFIRKAEILISATGIPGLIKKEMVKKGAVVIDVGSPKGDVDFEEVKKVASFITPVPGGVGPLTVVSLLENLFLSQKLP